MLTLHTNQLKPISTQITLKKIADAQNLEEMCELIEADPDFVYIQVPKQETIYKKVHQLGMFTNRAIPLTATLMTRWVASILPCFEASTLRDTFLKEAAQAAHALYEIFDVTQLSAILDKLAYLADRLTYTTKEPVDRLDLIYARLYGYTENLIEEPTAVTSLQEIAPTLRTLISQFLAINILPTPAHISIVLKVLSRCEFSSEEANHILTILARKIEENTKQFTYFRGPELVKVFWGICRSRFILKSDALQGILQVLLPQLNMIDDDTIACIARSLKYQPSSDVTTKLLSIITTHVNTQTHSRQWISTENISPILSGLETIGQTYSKITETLLTALLPHIDQIPAQNNNYKQQQKRVWATSFRGMGHILDGLQYLSNSTAALQILTILTTKLYSPSWNESKALSSPKWLANVIYSLRFYLDETATADVRKVAMTFIDTAVEKLNLHTMLVENNLAFNEADLAEKDERELLIMRIGGFTDLDTNYIDLSGYACSDGLVSFIASYIKQLEIDNVVSIPRTSRPIYFQHEDPSKNVWYDPHDIEELETMIITDIFEYYHIDEDIPPHTLEILPIISTGLSLSEHDSEETEGMRDSLGHSSEEELILESLAKSDFPQKRSKTAETQ